MNELTKAKRRIKRLERCLQDVITILSGRAEFYERDHNPFWENDPAAEDIRTYQRALNRIGRTLNPRKHHGNNDVS